MLSAPDILPVIKVLVAPPIVRPVFKTTALADLLNVNVPASVLNLAALVATVIVLLKILSPLIFLIAPSFEIPVPDTVITSSGIVMPSCNCRAAKFVIVVEPTIEPSALLCLIFNTPFATTILPSKLLLSAVSLNVFVLVPSFVNIPVPTILPFIAIVPFVNPPIFKL